jgi:hypothetical protein
MSASLASNLASLWHFESGGIAYDCAVERCKAKRDAAIWSHAYRALQLTSAVRHSLDFSGLVLS